MNTVENSRQQFRLSLCAFHLGCHLKKTASRREGKVFKSSLQGLKNTHTLPSVPAAQSLASGLQSSSCPVTGFRLLCDSHLTERLLHRFDLVLNRLEELYPDTWNMIVNPEISKHHCLIQS